MIYGYSPDALVYDSGSNSWSLRPDYDFTQHRVEIEFTDDDGIFDGDGDDDDDDDDDYDEIGEDSTQTATISDTNGTLIASGQVYDELYYEIESPSGDPIYLEVVEINGVVVGFVTDTALEVGISYVQTGTGGVDEDSSIAYSTLASVPCFAQNTQLTTDQGEMPVAWIRTGDRVLTRDHGYQPVLWIDRTQIHSRDLVKHPNLRPIRMIKGCVGNGFPTHDLLLSPEHRVLLKSYQVEMLFGCDEAFTPIKAITNDAEITQTQPDHDVFYYHILFEDHEIVQAEGIWVESFFPGKLALAALPPRKQMKVRKLLGPKTDTMQTARLCLKPWEAKLLTPQKKRNIYRLLSAA